MSGRWGKKVREKIVIKTSILNRGEREFGGFSLFLFFIQDGRVRNTISSWWCSWWWSSSTRKALSSPSFSGRKRENEDDDQKRSRCTLSLSKNLRRSSWLLSVSLVAAANQVFSPSNYFHARKRENASFMSVTYVSQEIIPGSKGPLAWLSSCCASFSRLRAWFALLRWYICELLFENHHPQRDSWFSLV